MNNAQYSDKSQNQEVCDESVFGNCFTNSSASSSRHVPNSISCSIESQLVEPSKDESNFEVLVRFPDGRREIFHFSPSLILAKFLAHFESFGFPLTEYEIVRVYPPLNLTNFANPLLTNLAKTGLKDKDTLFIQEI